MQVVKQRKACIKCKRLLPLDDYSPNGLDRYGQPRWRGACKVCEKRRHRKFRNEHMPYVYLTLKCAKCSDKSRVRISKSKEDGTHAYLCEKCTLTTRQATIAKHTKEKK